MDLRTFVLISVYHGVNIRQVREYFQVAIPLLLGRAATTIVLRSQEASVRIVLDGRLRVPETARLVARCLGLA